MLGPENPTERFVHEACIEAGARTEIICALEGDTMGAGLVEPFDAIAHGGNLYNSISASMRILRREPEAELISGSLPQSLRSHQLAGILFNLLSGSVDRVSKKAYATTFSSKATDFNNCCEESESKFLYAIDGNNRRARENTLLVSKSGAPVLFQKAQDCPTAISFADLAVNGVAYPAGTIFRAKIRERTLIPSDEMKIGFATPESVLAIGGLRLSTFKLRDQAERTKITDKIKRPHPDLGISVMQLTKRLPSRDILQTFMLTHGHEIE